MRTPRTIKDALIAMALGVSAMLVSNDSLPEPTDGGRTLTQWLDDLTNQPAGPEYFPAAEAIKRMGPKAVPFLVQKVAKHEQEHQASNAFRELGAVAKDAAPGLTALLDAPKTANVAAHCLVAIGEEAPVIACLNNKATRDALVIALGSHNVSKAAVAPLLGLLHDDDRNVRAHAVGSLGMIGQELEVVGPVFVQLLSDPDDYVAQSAAGSLSMIWEHWQVPHEPLIQAMNKGGIFVAPEAARVLGLIVRSRDSTTKQRIVDALIEALDDQRPYVVMSAAYALGGNLPEMKRARARLVELCNSSDKTLADTAARVVKGMDLQESIEARARNPR